MPKWLPWLLLPAGIVAAIVLFTFDPHQSTLFPPCPFKALTGWVCPGCGSTRAMHCLLHGQVLQALERNPLMVISLPILAAMFAWPSIAKKPWVAWSALVILVSYGILRNIPFAPFEYLAP